MKWFYGTGDMVLRRGWGQEGEMTQALYAHMNKKTIKKRRFPSISSLLRVHFKKL
jgi:hypothetical protein